MQKSPPSYQLTTDISLLICHVHTQNTQLRYYKGRLCTCLMCTHSQNRAWVCRTKFKRQIYRRGAGSQFWPNHNGNRPTCIHLPVESHDASKCRYGVSAHSQAVGFVQVPSHSDAAWVCVLDYDACRLGVVTATQVGSIRILEVHKHRCLGSVCVVCTRVC